MELVARKTAVEKALADWESASSKPTMQVQFRGASRQIPVISVIPSLPLLNHDNYRFAAQLEDHSMRAKVLSEPFTKESQDFLASLLSETDEFKKLKDQLEELGQRDPGLVTRDGLLVNGNTRTVALRALGVSGIRVGVLPDDTTHEDIVNLQVELQMLRLVQQDYTFTNELLLIDNQMKDADLDGVSRKLGWPVGAISRKKLEQKARILQMIREIRKMHQGEPLPYSIFDEKQELLENLDKAYQREKERDFNAAEALKWSRVAGMLSGLTKDQVRTIDDCFIVEKVQPRVPGNALIRIGESQGAGLFGGSGSVATMARDLASQIVNAKYDDSGKEVALNAGAVYEVALGMQVAAEQKINDNRLNQMLTDPIKHLRESRMKFEDIFGKFTNLAEDQNFDMAEFQNELEKVNDVIARLSESAGKLES